MPAGEHFLRIEDRASQVNSESGNASFCLVLPCAFQGIQLDKGFRATLLSISFLGYPSAEPFRAFALSSTRYVVAKRPMVFVPKSFCLATGHTKGCGSIPMASTLHDSASNKVVADPAKDQGTEFREYFFSCSMSCLTHVAEKPAEYRNHPCIGRVMLFTNVHSVPFGSSTMSLNKPTCCVVMS